MPQSAFEYLSSHELLFLATASSDGRPHAAPIFYVSEGQAAFFSVAPGSESARNLDQNPLASFAVADVPSDWSKARGLQVTGRVSQVSGDEQQRVGELFSQRFTAVSDAASYTYYRLDPDEVHYIHNDEEADEDIEALGVHWLRETVQP